MSSKSKSRLRKKSDRTKNREEEKLETRHATHHVVGALGSAVLARAEPDEEPGGQGDSCSFWGLREREREEVSSGNGVESRRKRKQRELAFFFFLGERERRKKKN